MFLLNSELKLFILVEIDAALILHRGVLVRVVLGGVLFVVVLLVLLCRVLLVL